MIHGDIERFAVQWELEQDPAGHFLRGRVCFWAGNTMVGDFGMTTALCDVLVSLAYPVGDCGNRRSETLCTLESEAAFYMLHAGLFESEPALATRVREESWARFDISIPVDVFDGWRLYLIDCEHESRLLIGRRSEGASAFQFVIEQPLPLGEFDRVITEFQRELQSVWEKHA